MESWTGAVAIELIRTLWSGQEVTFEGKYYQTHKARLYTPPKSSIPLYVSTMVPESAGFAGRYGDGLISVGGKPPEIYQQIMQNFESGARETEIIVWSLAKLSFASDQTMIS